MECGELCVTVDGTSKMPQWCANSLDTRTQVNETFITALLRTCWWSTLCDKDCWEAWTHSGADPEVGGAMTQI